MKKLCLVVLLLVLSSLPAYAQDDNKTYLPLVNGGSSILDAVHIPPCTDEELAALNKPRSATEVVPDNPSDDGCLLPTETFPGDTHPLIFQGDQDYGPVQASEANYWTWPRRVVLYRLHCYTAYGCSNDNTDVIEGVQGLFPAIGGTLPSGGSWYDYFVGSWASIGPPITGYLCGITTRPHILIGIGQGRFSSSYVSTTPKIFVERYSAYEGCTTTVATGYTPSGYDVHWLQLYRNSYNGTLSYWTARYWANNQWYYIWTNEEYDSPTVYMMIGGEAGATTLTNADNLVADMQYISKIRLKIVSGWKSYHEKNIGYLANSTTKQADSPAVMLDWNTGYSFTSLAWEINDP